MQSEAFDGEYVYSKITQFLEDHGPYSSVFNQAKSTQGTQFTQITRFIEDKKAVLKSVLEQKEPTLDQRTAQLWYKIQHGQLTFDLLEQQLLLLDFVNVTSVMSFYSKYILNPATYHKMIIVVNGKDRDFHPHVTYPLDYAHLPDSYPVP